MLNGPFLSASRVRNHYLVIGAKSHATGRVTVPLMSKTRSARAEAVALRQGSKLESDTNTCLPLPYALKTLYILLLQQQYQQKQTNSTQNTQTAINLQTLGLLVFFSRNKPSLFPVVYPTPPASRLHVHKKGRMCEFQLQGKLCILPDTRRNSRGKLKNPLIAPPPNLFRKLREIINKSKQKESNKACKCTNQQ